MTKKKVFYIFDFGEEWRFSCHVLSQIEVSTPTPICIRSQEIRAIFPQLLAQEALYCLWKDDTVWCTEALWVGDFTAAEECLAETEGKARYIPLKDELLRYADMSYYEQTPQIKAVDNYFALRHRPTAAEMEELLEQLHMLALFNHQPSEIMTLLASRESVFDVK